MKDATILITGGTGSWGEEPVRQLIPHTVGASRRGQVSNAEYFRAKGYAELLLEPEMTRSDLLHAIDWVYRNRKTYVDQMRACETRDSVNRVLALIRSFSRARREREA